MVRYTLLMVRYTLHITISFVVCPYTPPHSHACRVPPPPTHTTALMPTPPMCLHPPHTHIWPPTHTHIHTYNRTHAYTPHVPPPPHTHICPPPHTHTYIQPHSFPHPMCLPPTSPPLPPTHRYQSSLDLSEATYDMIKHLTLARDLGTHARQQLVMRLDQHCERHNDLFQKVLPAASASCRTATGRLSKPSC